MGRAARERRRTDVRRIKFLIDQVPNPGALIGQPMEGKRFGIDAPIGRIVAFEDATRHGHLGKILMTAELFERTRELVLERMGIPGGGSR